MSENKYTTLFFKILIMDILPVGLEERMKEMLFVQYPSFKEWIEQTDLFYHIKRFVGTGLIIEVIPSDLRLKLDKIVKVEKAEDLPIELIQNFYENSPFYTNETLNQKQINLNNESTDQENLW